MRIQLFSDLHLERDPAFQPDLAPDTDVIVLAGDIGSYQERSRLTGTDFGLERFAPPPTGATKRACCTSPATTNSTASNSTSLRAPARNLRPPRHRMARPRDVTIDHVRFIGTTLWADFDALAGRATIDEAAAAARKGLPRRQLLPQQEHHLPQWRTGAGRRLAARCRSTARQWLRAALAAPFDGPRWPSPTSRPACAAPTRAMASRPARPASATALDDLIPLRRRVDARPPALR
jgi:hypothetical protein